MWDANEARAATVASINNRQVAMESFFKECSEKPLQERIELASSMGLNHVDYDIYRNAFEGIQLFTITEYINYFIEKLKSLGYVIDQDIHYYQNFITVPIDW